MINIDRKELLKYNGWCVVIVCMVLLICSCRSVQYVPVETIKTEIKFEKSKDSTRIVDKVNVRDSVRVRDSVVTIVNDNGDIIRTEIWHWKEKYSDMSTFYQELQAKYDSLYTAKRDSIQVPYPVEKKLTKWQSLKMDIGGIAIGGIIVLLFIVIWLILKNRRK